MEPIFEFTSKGEKEIISLEKSLTALKSYCINTRNENVELAIQLNLNKKQIKKAFNSSVVLPYMEVKKTNVIAFVKEDQEKSAYDSGVSLVITPDTIKTINKSMNFSDYHFAVCTPDMLPKLRPIRSLLGPRGLMPNTKNGTISTDIGLITQKLKEQKLTYKADKFGVIHVVIGNTTYSLDQIDDNLKFLLSSVQEMKPQNVKGSFVKKMYITTTLGPSYRLSYKEFLLKK